MGLSAAAALALAHATNARPAAAPVTVVSVIAGKPSEFGFLLSRTTVPLGVVSFELSDAGQLPHSFKVCAMPLARAAASLQSLANTCNGPASPPVSPGGAVTLQLVFRTKGNYEYLCTLPGHASFGQKGVLTVS